MNQVFCRSAILLIMIAAIGCTGKKSEVTNEKEMPSLEMYVFDVGKIQVNDISQLNGGEEVTAPFTLQTQPF